MLAATVWRWMLRHATRCPGTWILLGGLAVLVPLGARLSPFPELGRDPAPALGEAWAVPTAVLGVILGLVVLSRRSPFLSLFAWKVRWMGELGALFLCAAGLQAPLWGGVLAAGGSLELGAVAWGLWVDLHIAALGVLLLRWSAGPGLRGVALLVSIGIVPGLVGEGAFAAPFRTLLDVDRERFSLETLGLRSLVSAIVSTATLLWVGYLVSSLAPAPKASPR